MSRGRGNKNKPLASPLRVTNSTSAQVCSRRNLSLVDEAGEKKMRATVKRIARGKTDNVRFYYLCATCLKRVETTGKREILSELPPAIVVG